MTVTDRDRQDPTNDELDLDSETVEDLEPSEEDADNVPGGVGNQTRACGGSGASCRNC